MPNNDADYLSAIEKLHNNVTIDISGRKHFKKWLWMLVFADERKFAQISKLRQLLENKFEKYVWFATQIQAMYGVLSDEDHKEARILDVKFINKSTIQHCLKLLSPDFRNAMSLFVKSEGTFEN